MTIFIYFFVVVIIAALAILGIVALALGLVAFIPMVFVAFSALFIGVIFAGYCLAKYIKNCYDAGSESRIVQALKILFYSLGENVANNLPGVLQSLQQPYQTYKSDEEDSLVIFMLKKHERSLIFLALLEKIAADNPKSVIQIFQNKYGHERKYILDLLLCCDKGAETLSKFISLLIEVAAKVEGAGYAGVVTIFQQQDDSGHNFIANYFNRVKSQHDFLETVGFMFDLLEKIAVQDSQGVIDILKLQDSHVFSISGVSDVLTIKLLEKIAIVNLQCIFKMFQGNNYLLYLLFTRMSNKAGQDFIALLIKIAKTNPHEVVAMLATSNLCWQRAWCMLIKENFSAISEKTTILCAYLYAKLTMTLGIVPRRPLQISYFNDKKIKIAFDSVDKFTGDLEQLSNKLALIDEAITSTEKELDYNLQFNALDAIASNLYVHDPKIPNYLYEEEESIACKNRYVHVRIKLIASLIVWINLENQYPAFSEKNVTNAAELISQLLSQASDLLLSALVEMRGREAPFASAAFEFINIKYNLLVASQGEQSYEKLALDFFGWLLWSIGTFTDWSDYKNFFWRAVFGHFDYKFGDNLLKIDGAIEKVSEFLANVLKALPSQLDQPEHHQAFCNAVKWFCSNVMREMMVQNEIVDKDVVENTLPLNQHIALKNACKENQFIAENFSDLVKLFDDKSLTKLNIKNADQFVKNFIMCKKL